ncbi:MAG: hypothetical protein GX208_01475 [Firmicutes bacterium]|nr:hypothetical protein [Bacillota bacterium]
MRKNLISKWSAGEQLGQLFMIEGTGGNPLIVTELGDDPLNKQRIQFWWNEGDDVIKGIAEALITNSGELTEELMIGLVLSQRGSIFYSWVSDIVEGDVVLVISQADQKIMIEQENVVGFFRWLRKCFQLMEKLVM